jgi:CRP-like cAMP-binding protein
MGPMRGRVAGINLEPALNRICGERSIDPDALSTLKCCVLRSQTHAAETPLDVPDGEASRRRIILRGWGARCRSLADGRRQIFSFLLPGDVVGGRLEGAFDSPVALTAVETVELGALCATLERPAWAQSITAAYESASHAQDELLFDHIVRLGQQNAVGRLASLLRELQRRLAAVGQARPEGFDMPLKQEHLAEALGLTLVHVNRTLQRMRAEGLLDIRGGKARLLDPRSLARLAGEAASEPFGPLVREGPAARAVSF